MTTIFFSAGGRVKKAVWKGDTFAELHEAYRSAFYGDNDALKDAFPELTRNAFYLRDKLYGVFYEGFDLGEVYDGAVIDVRDTNVVADGPFAITETREAGLVENSKSAAGEEGEDGSVSIATKEGPKTYKERLWELLDEPTSSKAASMFTVMLLVLIVFSTTTFCLETLPIFYSHETSTDSPWYIMEAVCISIFTLEFILRVLSCPSIPAYFSDTMNIIDVIAILPFYVEVVMSSVEIPGLAVFRVVRLVRVFRLFKVSRGSITLFASTMRKSAKPLYMLVFFTSIAMIVFSSLMYYAERGIYDEEIGAWMRISYYKCPILISTDPALPIGPEYANTLDTGHDESCAWTDPQPEGLEAHEAYFTCPYDFPKNKECKKIYEMSPFESIPASFWWCLVTMTTVGYGDMYPTAWYGKMLGMIVMMFGILVIALPITVIGSNFATVYKDMLETVPKDDEEAKEEDDLLDELQSKAPEPSSARNAPGSEANGSDFTQVVTPRITSTPRDSAR